VRRILTVVFALTSVAALSFAGVRPQGGVRPQVLSNSQNGVSAGDASSALVPVDLPTDGQWYYSAADFSTIGPDDQGGWMYIPGQDQLWLINSLTDPVMFRITDAWLTGDQFEVYVNGLLALTTNAVPDGGSAVRPAYPSTPIPFPVQTQVWAAYAHPGYSHGEIVLEPGIYFLNVKMIASATTGAGFGVLAEPYHEILNEITPKAGTEGSADVNGSWTGVKNLFR
jgi:hypothetical protein